MRIIGGKNKGLKLAGINGDWIRPTSDKVRGAVFSSLLSMFGTEKLVFVDCFAGSGAMAIEALSRGFEEVYLFDNNRRSLEIIRKNLKSAGENGKAHLIYASALKGLEQLKANNVSADIFFMDPPYKKLDLVYELLDYIERESLLTSDGIIVIEHDKNDIINQVIGKFELFKEKKYGNTVISYLEGKKK